MLSKSIERIFAEQDRKLEEQRREFDAKMKIMKKYYDVDPILSDEKWAANRSERRAFRTDLHEAIKSFTRWSMGAIIAVGVGLALYLTILIRTSH